MLVDFSQKKEGKSAMRSVRMPHRDSLLGRVNRMRRDKVL